MSDDDSFTIEPAPLERRAHLRYEIMAQVEVRHLRTTYLLKVGNLSRSGLFVRVQDRKKLANFRVGQELRLELFVTEEPDTVPVTGRVMRVVAHADPEDEGFGAKFVRVDAETDAKLARLVRMATELAPGKPPPLPPEGGDAP